MKTIRYLPRAEKALFKYRVHAKRIIGKLMEYADNPSSQANNLKRLHGRHGTLRLRVGNFRVLFSEDEDTIVVADVGPRGSIYEQE
jgi:mRNA interferase RelE/StbE